MKSLRRIGVIAMAMILASTVLVFAGGGEESSTGAVQSQQITMSHNQGEWIWGALDELAALYEESTGNTVEFIYVPQDGYAQWTRAQMVAGTEPDVMWGGHEGFDSFRNNQIIDLRPYYEGISPFTGKPWQESFLDGILAGTIDENLGDAMVGMPIAMVTVNLYYNRDIFKELGLPDEAPRSWGAVLDVCKKIAASGKDVVPFSVMNSIGWNLTWIPGTFMEDLWVNSGVVEKLDIITPNGTLENPELMLGIKTGVIDLMDQRFIDYYSFLKELSAYFNTGFNAASWEYEKLFNEGMAAMQINGSWYPNQHLTSGFEVNYGIGPLPYVSKDISNFSRNKQMRYALGVGGPNVVITSRAAKEGRADAAANFLQFLTDPETGAKFFIEKTMFLPVVKGVPVAEELEGLVSFIGSDQAITRMANIYRFNAEVGARYHTMQQAFLENDKSAREFAAEVAKLGIAAVDQIIEDQPELRVMDFIDKVKK